ncbi:MAG: hypothetical protein ACK4FJ_00235 [Ferrovibrio sp.]|uniref:hypothetical protein n=1 Tax=Ferrovibrio sp. TaxID=1917215 RepID=UPI003919A412
MAALLVAGPAAAQTQAPATQAPATQAPAAQAPATQTPAQMQGTTPPTPSTTDPRAAAEPQTQPIKPQTAPKAAPKPAPKNANAPPRNQTMAFTLPDLVPIAEIPRGKAVMLQGVVMSPQATTFVLNDGNASQVINLGPSWRDLTKVKAGDRVRVIGQMDPYGAPVFRAGSVVLENNRIVVVPNG